MPLQKFTQIGIFGFKVYIPSGNPATNLFFCGTPVDWPASAIQLPL
jgi:hypothetical protein